MMVEGPALPSAIFLSTELVGANGSKVIVGLLATGALGTVGVPVPVVVPVVVAVTCPETVPVAVDAVEHVPTLVPVPAAVALDVTVAVASVV